MSCKEIVVQFNKLSHNLSSELTNSLLKIQELSKSQKTGKTLISEGVVFGIMRLISFPENPHTKVLCDIIAELAKINEDTRTTLAVSGVFPFLFTQIEDENPEIVKLATRALANLAFQHCDNSEEISKGDLLEKILLAINKFKTDPELVRVCVGLILNLSDDSEEFQILVGQSNGIEIICSFLDTEHELVLSVVMRALIALVESSENISYLGKIEIINNLKNLIKTKQDEIQEMAADLLLTISSNEKCKQLLLTKEFIQECLDLFKLDLLINTKEYIIKLLSYIALSNFGMNTSLEKGSIKLVKEFISSPTFEISLASAMWLANLIRTDESCISLMDSKVLSCLKKLVKNKNTKISILIIGILRNFAIPEENKPKFYDDPEIIDLILQFIEHEDLRVQDHACSCLRLLSSCKKLTQMLLEKGVIDKLLKQVFSDEVQRIQYSASRALNNLIFNINDENTLGSIVEKDGAAAMFLLLESQFGVFRKEAAMVFNKFSNFEKLSIKIINNENLTVKMINDIFSSEDSSVLEPFCLGLKKFLENKLFFEKISDKSIIVSLIRLKDNLTISQEVVSIVLELLEIFEDENEKGKGNVMKMDNEISLI
ncbi:rap1 gtpase-gdp dissociation stimulator [Anaeramoeba flamelloides]|uniref:Rap1 gtpase-gdp dissociation stimulator n=1 Tax=Anaeramoeba flamelloides TaxID=1746091 RepID=A0AAV7ZQT4_9EUKA|nr:rap1 gtpase-gdp dissociation stimulator [Anaeramoeba flamelloides]